MAAVELGPLRHDPAISLCSWILEHGLLTHLLYMLCLSCQLYFNLVSEAETGVCISTVELVTWSGFLSQWCVSLVTSNLCQDIFLCSMFWWIYMCMVFVIYLWFPSNSFLSIICTSSCIVSHHIYLIELNMFKISHFDNIKQFIKGKRWCELNLHKNKNK